MSDVLRTLVAARALLSKPGAWCQHAFAVSSDDDAVGPHHPKAVSWCLMGAIERVTELPASPLEAYWVLSPSCNCQTITGFNDALGRTQGEVLAFLDEKIASLSGQCPVGNTETIVEASDIRELELEAV